LGGGEARGGYGGGHGWQVWEWFWLRCLVAAGCCCKFSSERESAVVVTCELERGELAPPYP
jgi:hypothetical protein